jgi:hypothetical protein
MIFSGTTEEAPMSPLRPALLLAIAASVPPISALAHNDAFPSKRCIKARWNASKADRATRRPRAIGATITSVIVA